MLYNVVLDGDELTIGFGEPAQNTEIVRELAASLAALPFPGGELLKISGPASLPAAMAICHHVAHLYGAVAVYDPKLGGYVVSLSHDPRFPIGDLIK